MMMSVFRVAERTIHNIRPICVQPDFSRYFPNADPDDQICLSPPAIPNATADQLICCCTCSHDNCANDLANCPRKCNGCSIDDKVRDY